MMEDSTNDSTQDIFGMFVGLDDETKERLAAKQAAQKVMIDRLEEKYVSRGLSFAVPFNGACPVQAYGHLDGLRFYFRFRSNTGSLKVGPYVEEVERLYAQRQNEDAARRKQEREAAGREVWPEPTAYPAAETDRDFYPHVIVKQSFVSGEDAHDIFNGFLTDEEAFAMFSRLVDSLEDVPVEKQMDEGTRIWLYEGREAHDVWRAEQERLWVESGEAQKAVDAYRARRAAWEAEEVRRKAEKENSSN